MNVYALACSLSFIIYLVLAVFVLSRNPKAAVNRIVALIVVIFAVWALQDTIRFSPGMPKDVALVFINIGAVGWCSWASLGLWFAMHFTGEPAPKARRVLTALLLSAAAFFVYQQWAGGLVVDLSRQFYGWGGVWSRSIWNDFYDIHLVVVGSAMLLMLNRHGRDTGKTKVRKQSIIFVATGGASFLLGFVLNRLAPRLGAHSVPQLASVAGLIWAAGLAHAMGHYDMLSVTPATAADTIVATMTDFLLLVDAQGTIVTVNKPTTQALGYRKNELLGQSIATVVSQSESREPTDAQDTGPAGVQHASRSTTLIRKSGERLPVLLSTSPPDG